jgi:hypothetical protein
MAILRDFENRLERIVEGFFSKAFRSGIQPVELARRILREMDATRTVGVREVWVPNRYTVTLSPEDRERLTGMEQALARELEQVVVDAARERGFGLVARPEVRFETDEGRKRGTFDVEAEMAEETGPPPSEVARPTGELPRTRSGRAALVLLEDGRMLREFPLTGERTTIGRMTDCDIELKDPGASRRHAEVRRAGNGYTVVDLDSTNGTMVNNANVKRHDLADGDLITIGRTTLEFRSG